jgi:hypothetical protein
MSLVPPKPNADWAAGAAPGAEPKLVIAAPKPDGLLAWPNKPAAAGCVAPPMPWSPVPVAVVPNEKVVVVDVEGVEPKLNAIAKKSWKKTKMKNGGNAITLDHDTDTDKVKETSGNSQLADKLRRSPIGLPHALTNSGGSSI